MHEGIRRVLRVSCATLVLASFLALVSTPNCGPATMALPCLLLLATPFGERLDARYKSYRRITTLGTGLFTLSLPIIGSALGLLGAVVVLVSFILAHKMAHQKAEKDYYQLFLMCFFLLVAACPAGPDALIAVAIAVFLVSAVSAMTALQLHVQSSRAGSAGVADLVRSTGKGSARSPSAISLFDSGLVGSVALLCAGCLLLTTVFFLFMPRVEAGVLGTSTALAPSHTGIPDTIELSEGGKLTPDTTAVMRVEFPEEPNGQYTGDMRWRVSAMNHYSRAMWERLQGQATHLGDALPPLGLQHPEKGLVVRMPRPQKRRVRQMIYLDEIPRDGLPCLPFPLEVSSEGTDLAWNERDGDLSVAAGPMRGAGLQYEVVSEVDQFTPRELREAPDDYRQRMNHRDHYMLTQHQLHEATVRLAQQIAAEQTNTYDRVQAIENWLQSDEFSYTLDRPKLRKTYAVDYFIHDVRRGHCELFASAMALMVRSLGIPARVVSGFRGGQWSERDNGYIIRNDMAHLWVEVYFLDLGWVTFDPSPTAQELAEDLQVNLATILSRYALKAKMVWYREVLGYSGQIKWADLERLNPWRGTDDTGPETAQSQGPRPPSPRLPLSFFGLIGFVFAAALFIYARWRAKDARQTRTEDQQRATRLFHEFTRRAKKLGVDSSGQTIGEIAATCTETCPAHAQAVEELLHAYNDVRFGGRALGPSRYAELRRLVRGMHPRRG